VVCAALTLATAGCAGFPSAPEPPPLDGTAWVLSALPGHGKGGGAAATLGFEGGRAQGSDGCNRYGMPFTAKGPAIEFSGRGVSTRMACPPEVMARADAFIAALAGGRTYRIAGGSLELLSGDGSLLATFAAQDRTLAGSAWRATAINDGRQAVVGVATGSEVTLVFSDDGQASGSAGCNRYTARYEAQGARLGFRAPAATRKTCPDPALMEQERAFLSALETVATLRREGDGMELRTAQGALAIELIRDGAP
jgi:heat shock protein HslJ